MMAVRGKQLSEASERVWLDGKGEPINIDRAWQKSDRRIALTRREQAMLAAAGMDGPEARWYVLRIENGMDKAVDKALEDANVEHCMLSLKLAAKRRGKRKHQKLEAVDVPAFPGYVFVKVVACPASWAGLQTIAGVVGPIGGGEYPAPVSANEITKLQAKIEKDPKAIAVLTNALLSGDKVMIDNGPFASFEAVVLMIGETDRIRVEASIFGRAVPIDLDLAQVTKLD
ncbi:transcription termination/antitermination protein NusG [Aminobacter sp. P9b]|uniref:transcription termination/antitermination protein NusG n=1 Tax=Aminobacter sp. P9b TaxID=3133697 RepID=UPI00324F3F97